MDWQYWPQNMREAPSYLIHHQNHHNFPDKSNFPEIPAMAAMSLWEPILLFLRLMTQLSASFFLLPPHKTCCPF